MLRLDLVLSFLRLQVEEVLLLSVALLLWLSDAAWLFGCAVCPVALELLGLLVGFLLLAILTGAVGS